MSTDITKLGLRPADIMLPAKGVDYSKFAVIACDQFSANPEYWDDVARIADGAPSTLNLILPEAHLHSPEDERRAAREIPQVMKKYLGGGVLEDIGECFIYVRRRTSAGIRRGLVAAFDLEQYEFTPDSESLIRATERTVIERLPARKQIRSSAPLELPHAMVLVDEPDNELFNMLEGARADMPLLYDFELMLGGGRIEGYRVGAEYTEKIAEILERDRDRRNGFLFAMGDGNHSFAAAKQWWDELKATLTPAQRENHPARYCLAELVNLHDEGLVVEPIHRLLIGVDPQKAASELNIDPECPPPLDVLQPQIDDYIAAHPGIELEYIHGADECRELAARADDRLAIVWSSFDRSAIFDGVQNSGCLPRKSFSLGVAKDKRYYLECRKIVKNQ